MNGGRSAGGAFGPKVTWASRLFEDKVALDTNYHWDGSDKGGDSWRETLRGYFIGCCPEIQPLLDWAESRDATPISEDEVKKRGEAEVTAGRMTECAWSPSE